MSNKHTHTHRYNGPFSRTTWVSRYQKGKTNLDFTEARDSEWQWHQLGHMQACTLLQTDNHTNTPPLSFLQAGCPSCRSTNSVKALKATKWVTNHKEILVVVNYWNHRAHIPRLIFLYICHLFISVENKINNVRNMSALAVYLIENRHLLVLSEESVNFA